MAAEEVSIVTSFGWVVLTPDAEAPFVIGPFTDEDEGRVWLENIRDHLVEDVRVLGPTMLFHPASYTQVSAAMRAKGGQVGALTVTNDLLG